MHVCVIDVKHSHLGIARLFHRMKSTAYMAERGAEGLNESGEEWKGEHRCLYIMYLSKEMEMDWS